MNGLSRDDILRMAREVAGVTYPAGITEVKIGMSEEHLQRFAASVAAAEREACEKACKQIGQHGIITQCVNAIRARGQQ